MMQTQEKKIHYLDIVPKDPQLVTDHPVVGSKIFFPQHINRTIVKLSDNYNVCIINLICIFCSISTVGPSVQGIKGMITAWLKKTACLLDVNGTWLRQKIAGFINVSACCGHLKSSWEWRSSCWLCLSLFPCCWQSKFQLFRNIHAIFNLLISLWGHRCGIEIVNAVLQSKSTGFKTHDRKHGVFIKLHTILKAVANYCVKVCSEKFMVLKNYLLMSLWEHLK